MPKLIGSGRMTVEKAEQILNSWLGHSSYACSYNFIQRLIERNNFIYIVKKKGKDVFKIDTNKLEVFPNGN